MKEGRPHERPSDLSPSSVAANDVEPRIALEGDGEPRIAPFDAERMTWSAVVESIDEALRLLQAVRERFVATEDDR